jgi:predicted nuclease with TOPRIM domain
LEGVIVDKRAMACTNDELRKSYEIVANENKDLKGKLELMNSKLGNLERENTKLYSDIHSLKTKSAGINYTTNSPKITNYEFQ